MRRPTGWGLALVAALGVSGAGCEKVAGLARRTAGSQGSLFEGQAAVAALEQLRQAAGGPQLRCLAVTVHSDRAELQFQQTGDPEKADAYRYQRGLVSGPLPVKLVGGGRLADNLFPLNEVELQSLPELFAEALRRTALEGGTLQELRIRREFSPLSPATRRALQEAARRGAGSRGPVEDFPDGAVVLQLSISGARRNATVRADSRGRVVTVKLI